MLEKQQYLMILGVLIALAALAGSDWFEDRVEALAERAVLKTILVNTTQKTSPQPLGATGQGNDRPARSGNVRD